MAPNQIYLVIRGTVAKTGIPNRLVNKETQPQKLNILILRDVDSFTGLMIARHHWLPVLGFSLETRHVHRACPPRFLPDSYDSLPLGSVSIKDRSLWVL